MKGKRFATAKEVQQKSLIKGEYFEGDENLVQKY